MAEQNYVFIDGQDSRAPTHVEVVGEGFTSSQKARDYIRKHADDLDGAEADVSCEDGTIYLDVHSGRIQLHVVIRLERLDAFDKVEVYTPEPEITS